GTLAIQNALSRTTINIDDSANGGATTAHMRTRPSGEAGWGDIIGLAPAEIQYKYADTSSVTIHTSSSDGDEFDVWDNRVPTTVISNGVATVRVGNDFLGVQRIYGTLDIENPSFSTIITVDDSANPYVTTSHMGTKTTGDPGWGYITGLAPADIEYKYLDT